MRAGLFWIATPLGILTFDTGRRDLPFTRCEVASWLDLGAAWDALPRTARRAMEADGLGRRTVEEPLAREFLRLARAAGW